MHAASMSTKPDASRARAFRSQYELPPYQELLRDTVAWVTPGIGQRWLDLGCGAGQLSRRLWEKSQGKVEAIIGVDAVEVNAQAYMELRRLLKPTPTPMCLRFVPRDFTQGFADWPEEQFDGVVSGLSLCYAESYSDHEGSWNEDAYDKVLAEMHRLLKPGGAFVFSVNVPEPDWSKIAWHALAGAIRKTQPLRKLKDAYRLWSHGNWLNRESSRGRFHYLPLDVIIKKLKDAGFGGIEHKLSYAGQAFVIRCGK